MKTNIYIVIPAAGKGERMGPNSNKLFMEVGGMPVIKRTLEAFNNYANKYSDTINMSVVVVTNRENIEPISEIVNKNNYSIVKTITEGGATRTMSVYNGIKTLSELTPSPADNDLVFIHDGARCLVSEEVISECISTMATNDVAVTGVNVKNTVKRVIDGIVQETLERSTLVEVQTPQCFKYAVITRSYDNAINNNIEATDDTALAELLGYKVAIAPGSYSNIKITTKEDLLIAEGLL